MTWAGFGSGVDYEKIREIVREEVGRRFAVGDYTKIPAIDYKDLCEKEAKYNSLIERLRSAGLELDKDEQTTDS